MLKDIPFSKEEIEKELAQAPPYARNNSYYMKIMAAAYRTGKINPRDLKKAREWAAGTYKSEYGKRG